MLCMQQKLTRQSLVALSSSSMTLLFYYLAPLQNDTNVMLRCMQFIFWDKGLYLKSVFTSFQRCYTSFMGQSAFWNNAKLGLFLPHFVNFFNQNLVKTRKKVKKQFLTLVALVWSLQHAHTGPNTQQSF